METGRILSQTAPGIVGPEGSGRGPVSRSGGLTCAHKHFYTLGRPALSQWYLVMLWSTVAQHGNLYHVFGKIVIAYYLIIQE